mmetsp:Transcript_22695/g.46004  ORF Transcript_22695/g.46004 Transcript_22695/m.46004 type:complete len:112 (+) Transcript_22695:1732-2067(+)
MLPLEENPRNLMSWRASCARCGRTLANAQGLFCRNFCFGRGPFPQCRKAWCGSCYCLYPADRYPTQETGNEEDKEGMEMEEEDKERYRIRRDSDHLMMPFQCDLYHFWNVQ